ncbi:MAG: ABC transporter substrate-binding protein [Prosthecobacter sp.]|nr:ABC transporter substrate-binding protein [Prosthecobacter sp.]
MFLKRLTLIATLTALGLSGCNKSGSSSGNIIRVGYIGLTCEAPIFSALENGFFKEEGLDVELVKCEWSKYKDVLALGGYDITHHLIMYFLKPIEQGLDVKISAGIHTGCLRVQVAKDGPIHTVQDLKGKRIGIPGMGTPPFIFATRVLGANGLDPGKDVEWRVFPAGELGLALDKGEIDAIADSEPIGTLLLAEGKVRNLADQARDEPYAKEYCCAVIVNGKYLAANPEKTAAATRALLKGAKWVETNPRAAARMSVEKKYLGSNPELNTTAISNLRYIPSVKGAEDAVNSAAEAMKVAGMLAPTTDVAALAKRAFVHLPGVTDEWVQKLEVQKVAGGQIPPDQAVRLAMELGLLGGPKMLYTCCGPAKRPN